MRNNFPSQDLFKVCNVARGYDQTLCEGDIIHSLSSKPVTKLSDFDSMYTSPLLSLRLLREGKDLTLDVPTTALTSTQTDQILWHAGMQIEPPYFPVPLHAKVLASQLYVTSNLAGSPAQLYAVGTDVFITAVNGKSVVGVEDFLREVGKVGDEKYFRLGLTYLDGSVRVVALMGNNRDFGTRIAKKEKDGWSLQEIEFDDRQEANDVNGEGDRSVKEEREKEKEKENGEMA